MCAEAILVISLFDALVCGLFLTHSSVWIISNSWQNQQAFLQPATHLHRDIECVEGFFCQIYVGFLKPVIYLICEIK